jgi:SAM-dependent methyltransferase
MTMKVSHPASHFERLYAERRDPYELGTRWYERRKYQLTLASLTRPRYEHALEIGCGEGLFTDQLAARCRALTALDASPTAIRRARARRSGRRPTVSFVTGVVPADWPAGEFDLIVVPEVGYYLAPKDLARLAERIAGCAPALEEVVAVHWRHSSATLPTNGELVHEVIGAELPTWRRHSHHVEQDFLLDVWTST